MVSDPSVSRAAEILDRAAAVDPSRPDGRLRRNLLIAAALREVLSSEPVVVGGTAEDYWSADEYHETDLDLVAWSLTPRDRVRLRELGFTKTGRHWVHAATGVPVEFPETTLAGDVGRIRREELRPGVAAIIGLEDLYLDRVRQSTVDPDDEALHTYRSALAIAASNFDAMDWPYVDAVIRGERQVQPELMRRIHRRIRMTVRDRLAGSP